MAVNNKLRVQGREPREDITEHYKGEKLNVNGSKYALNDVVSIKGANDEITFEKHNGTSFESYPNFQLNILDKSFSSESVYYYTLNNAFNTCRIITYNLMNLLKDYSGVSNITLNKDTNANDCNTILEDSLSNLIKYNFYNSNENALFDIRIEGINTYFQIDFHYKRMFYKNRGQSNVVSNISSGGSILCEINDSSLEFNNSDKILKHKDRPSYSFDKTSSGTGYGTHYNDIDYNREGWDQVGTFYNYILDEQGHVISKEQKTITLPQKPRFKKTILYSGDRGTGTLSETFMTDILASFDLIEVVFRNNDADTIESIYVEPSLIPTITGEIKFHGVKFKTAEQSSTDSYGHSYTSRNTSISISSFSGNYAIPKVRSYAQDDSCIWIGNSYKHIIRIIAYERII